MGSLARGPVGRGGYGGPVRKNPDAREPRAPAIVIWTVTGVLVGLALGVVLGNFAVPMTIGAAVGLLYGFFTTRPRGTPNDH